MDEQCTFSINDSYESGVAPDSAWVAGTSDTDAEVTVWSLADESVVFNISSINGRSFQTCGAVKFSPDESMLSFTHEFSDDGSVEISHVDTSGWSLMSNATIDTVDGPTGVYYQFDYSPDGQHFCFYNDSDDQVEIRSIGGDEQWSLVGAVGTTDANFRGMAYTLDGYAHRRSVW